MKPYLAVSLGIALIVIFNFFEDSAFVYVFNFLSSHFDLQLAITPGSPASIESILLSRTFTAINYTILFLAGFITAYLIKKKGLFYGFIVGLLGSIISFLLSQLESSPLLFPNMGLLSIPFILFNLVIAIGLTTFITSLGGWVGQNYANKKTSKK